jgi:hypothetical protein
LSNSVSSALVREERLENAPPDLLPCPPIHDVAGVVVEEFHSMA